MEITKREILFSIIIILIMFTIGLFINEKISSLADEKSQEYEQAAKIDENTELFEYAMRTNAGKAFVHGVLKAVDPVSIPDIEGEYATIRKTEERYTRHTRMVTKTDSEGNTYTEEEVYYTWDETGHEDFICTTISFLGHEFEYGKIEFPTARYLKTIKKWGNIRYIYEVRDTEYAGTIYARLADNTIYNAEFMEKKNINEAVERMKRSTIIGNIVFWVLYVCLIGAAVFCFYYFDNKWIEG